MTTCNPAMSLTFGQMSALGVSLLCVLLGLASAQSTFRFSNTHGDHMVLQQGPAKASLWGVGTPGASVSVSLSPAVTGGSGSGVVGADGYWAVEIGPVSASFTAYVVTAASNGQTAALQDVLFGDVWLCSGQSNMQFTVDSAFNATAEIAAAADFPMIRVFTAAMIASDTPLVELAQVEEAWSVASPAAIGGGNWTYFSAMCWFYGRDIFQELQYPIGLIATDWGGTPVEAWSSPAALAKCPHSPPEAEPNDSPSPDAFSTLWNAMIVPFLRSTINGAIWYQGEADAESSTQVAIEYACTFPAMISDWRSNWANMTNTNPVFPFGFVVLSTWDDEANTTCGNNPSQDCPVAQVRWGQTAGVGYVPNDAMPNTFFAIAFDYGDATSPFSDIHPRYKQQVAARLANAGLAVAYGQSERYWSGPIATSATTNGTAVTITFESNGASGLYIKNTNYVHFELETSTNVWVAVAITGSTASTVTLGYSGTPSTVRYNWYTAPCEPVAGPLLCAVYSAAEQLPAMAFIMDITSA